jgi:hypothetical protein
VVTKKKRIRMRLRVKGDAELELWAAHRHTGALAEVFHREILVEPPPGALRKGKQAPRPARANARGRRAAARRRTVTRRVTGN